MQWVCALVAAATVSGCDVWDIRSNPVTPEEELAGPPIGETHRSYNALPWYLICRLEPPLGPIDRWDERVPVAGGGGEGLTDELRVRLAELDQETVTLRG